MRNASDRLPSGHSQLNDVDVSIGRLMISAISRTRFFSLTTVDGGALSPSFVGTCENATETRRG